MYLTNDERIRLSLQQYGSDVPAEVVEAAEAALASPCGGACPAPTKTSSKTRARNKQGQFEGDDLETPAVNEAYVDG